MIITLDGLSGTGKTTLGRQLARRLKGKFLSSGWYYRAVAYHIISGQAEDVPMAMKTCSYFYSPVDAELLPALDYPNVVQKAAQIKNYPQLRATINRQIQDYVRQHPAEYWVIDGRDAGTEIFPNADIKFYIWCTSEERFKRKGVKLVENGIVLESDMIIIDTSESIEYNLDKMVNISGNKK